MWKKVGYKAEDHETENGIITPRSRSTQMLREVALACGWRQRSWPSARGKP